MVKRARLAVVLSHPTQYYAPWFRQLAAEMWCELKVFYLWDFGMVARVDPTFQTVIKWDVPLLDGYAWELVPNVAEVPGTSAYRGLDNPQLVERLVTWKPEAVLLFGYTWKAHGEVMRSGRLREVPLIFRGDSHEIARPMGWRTLVGRVVRRLVFRRFAGFLAVGEANRKYFIAHGVKEDKVVRSPHCVDKARFKGMRGEATEQAAQWRRELEIPEEAVVFLFAGKFEEKKRPMDLLRAYISIAQEGGGCPWLLMVGSGAQEADLKEVAERCGLGRIRFAGFQNQSLMPRTWITGDVLVLPSYGNGETWGLAVNEAMHMERPVIVSDHVGCAVDMVQHGKTGFVFAAGEVEALAEVMRGVTKAGLREMGREAARHAEGYSYEAASEGLKMVLEKIKVLEGDAG